jgi:hypothetical protein
MTVEDKPGGRTYEPHVAHRWPLLDAEDQFFCLGVPDSSEKLSERVFGEHDPVNHPSHYTSHPSGVECIVVTRHMNFNLGNVVKYLWRAGMKEEAPTIQDLEKAAWYLNDEIEQRKKEASD